MSYFAIDDDFHLHPKVVECVAAIKSNSAIGLWARAGSWCQKHLTDGLVPHALVAMLDGSDADAEALVACGLWERVPRGYQFHEWSQRNGQRESILRRRRAESERKARGARTDSARNPHGRVADSMGPTPTPTPKEKEDLNLPPPQLALTASTHAHAGIGRGGDECEQGLSDDDARAQLAFAWLHGLLMETVTQPAPRLKGRWFAAYCWIASRPAAEVLRVESCLRSELRTGRLRARVCTPGHVADYWHAYVAHEPPGAANGRRSGPSVVGTQAEHDAELTHEEPLQ